MLIYPKYQRMLRKLNNITEERLNNWSKQRISNKRVDNTEVVNNPTEMEEGQVDLGEKQPEVQEDAELEGNSRTTRTAS